MTKFFFYIKIQNDQKNSTTQWAKKPENCTSIMCAWVILKLAILAEIVHYFFSDFLKPLCDLHDPKKNCKKKYFWIRIVSGKKVSSSVKSAPNANWLILLHFYKIFFEILHCKTEMF